MALRTGNPALNANTFTSYVSAGGRSDVMTLDGTVNKAGILLILLVASAAFVWHLFISSAGGGAATGLVGLLMIAGVIGGLIFAIATILKKTWSPISAPLYAISEGLFLGGISAMLEASYPGIVIQAVGLTFGTLFALLLAYKSGLIKATENFKIGVVAATGGIAIVYLVTIILGFFHIRMPFIHEAGPIGILFSLFVVVIAALNLVLDFDFIEQGAGQGAPKYMEWYAAFGLMVTLVWLYIEILRLITKLRSRD